MAICTPDIINVGSIVCIESPFVLQIAAGPNQVNVETVLTLPAGTIYNSHVISAGTWDTPSLTWLVDLVEPDSETISICVEVTDLALFTASDRKVIADVTAVIGEVNIINNQAERCILGFTSLELLPCQSPIVPIETVTVSTIVDPSIHATLLVDSSLGPIDITIDPTDLFLAGCGSYTIDVKAIDVTNPINIITTSGVIVDFTTVAGGVVSLPILNIGESKAIRSDNVNLFVV